MHGKSSTTNNSKGAINNEKYAVPMCSRSGSLIGWLFAFEHSRRTDDTLVLIAVGIKASRQSTSARLESCTPGRRKVEKQPRTNPASADGHRGVPFCDCDLPLRTVLCEWSFELLVYVDCLTCFCAGKVRRLRCWDIVFIFFCDLETC